MRSLVDSTPYRKGTVVSGMRPTGELHIGHFESVLRNWVALQNSDDACFYFVADWHALTTELATRDLQKYTLSIVKDWLAFGVDPAKATIFVQSAIPEHAELALILERLVNIGTAERIPTFKAYTAELAGKRVIRENDQKVLEGEERLNAVARAEVSVGFLAYPILQAADILLYQATHVPVGEDQLPHIELTRALARTFNRHYGEFFVLPEALLSAARRIRGIDGRKMSKSYENDIAPFDDPETIEQKIARMLTVRARREDKGDPDACPVYDLHHIYNAEGESDIRRGCQEAAIGCYDCKKVLPPRLAETYGTYRERKAKISDEFVKEVLREGNKRARAIAAQTMDGVKSRMLMDYLGERSHV